MSIPSLLAGPYRALTLRLKGVPPEILRTAGKGFYCGRGAFFRRGEDIVIGRNVFMGIHVHIATPCTIGNDVLFASYVALVGGDHRFDQPGVPLNASGRATPSRIVIEDDVWIGHGSIVLAGVRIGRGAIVAAGSIVTHDVPPCTICGSSPATILRERFLDPADRDAHLAFLADRYGPREVG